MLRLGSEPGRRRPPRPVTLTTGHDLEDLPRAACCCQMTQAMSAASASASAMRSARAWAARALATTGSIGCRHRSGRAWSHLVQWPHASLPSALDDCPNPAAMAARPALMASSRTRLWHWPLGSTRRWCRSDLAMRTSPSGRVSASVEKEDGRRFPMSSQLRRETHARACTSIACGAHPRPDRPALHRPVT
jgi:hypothetical protein